MCIHCIVIYRINYPIREEHNSIIYIHKSNSNIHSLQEHFSHGYLSHVHGSSAFIENNPNSYYTVVLLNGEYKRAIVND